MEVVQDAKWFHLNQGLRNEGLSLKFLSNAHTTLTNISSYFGPKLNKNGWNYEEM
jgi:hypothetical protein